jgi:hypothetical protein
MGASSLLGINPLVASVPVHYYYDTHKVTCELLYSYLEVFLWIKLRVIDPIRCNQKDELVLVVTLVNVVPRLLRLFVVFIKV